MSNPGDLDDFEDYSDECWNCGGEGFVASCMTEYACVDPEWGCDLCTKRCEICNPKPTPPAGRET